MKLPNNPQPRSSPESIRGSFTLWDLIVVIVVVLFLGGWFVFAHSGERGRIARCAGNLEHLGQAIQNYANDHDDGIPAAGISLGKIQSSWQMESGTYLKPGLAVPKSAYDKKKFLAAIQPFFFCPSDFIRRANPRSYAMGERDMNCGWPPTSNDKTGIGTWWANNTIAVLGPDAAQAAQKNPDSLPKLKLSVLPDSANTLLVTELIGRNNRMDFGNVRVGNVNEQQAEIKNPSLFHFGRFNYLMADGHVELLTPLQTGGIGDSPSGIWTIKAGD